MSNQPAYKVRIGLVTATVWENEGHYSVEAERSYKKTDSEWRTSSSFGHSDLLNLAKCIERAEIWITRQITPKLAK